MSLRGFPFVDGVSDLIHYCRPCNEKEFDVVKVVDEPENDAVVPPIRDIHTRLVFLCPHCRQYDTLGVLRTNHLQGQCTKNIPSKDQLGTHIGLIYGFITHLCLQYSNYQEQRDDFNHLRVTYDDCLDDIVKLKSQNILLTQEVRSQSRYIGQLLDVIKSKKS